MKIQNNQPFEKSANYETKTAVLTISSGSAKLQACNGRDPDAGTWVDVPDSSHTASTVFSFYCSRGLLYRWVLSGDAAGYMSN
jgi:hypothetical protein